MSYSTPFVRVKFQGHFGASGTDKKEFWSAGVNIANPAGLTSSSGSLSALLTAIAPAVSAFHSNTTTKAGTLCFLDTLSAALIATNGRYAGGSAQATTIYTYPAPVAGTTLSSAPYSQAIVWTLRSAILRGPGSHGRVYYPALGYTVGGDTGVLSSATQSAYVATVLILVNAINSAASAGLGAGSNISNVSSIGLGYQSPVTKVGIGARLDAQESRERNLAEAHVFGNTTIAREVLEQVDQDLEDLLEEEWKRDRENRPGGH